MHGLVNDAAAVDDRGEIGNERLQYLTFLLGGQEYGVDILRVQEIKGWDGVTRVPNTPPHVKGVINLRGSIVPVIDLRIRLGIEEVTYGSTTVIVIVRIDTPKGRSTTGLVVDAVADVFTTARSELQETPDFGEGADVDYIEGVAIRGEAMLIALALDRLLSAGELEALARMG
ncbi:MAG: purine-binding chemotaxis protein CheW [Planctomycetes bacterium]|nr:purine-binding chemotaxis protein CheW [Planctomycetota bacterium]